MPVNPKPNRIFLLDAARTGAIIMMILYHFVFDLELFGYVPPGTAISMPWRALALLTAGAFLFLSGVSLWLAHGAHLRRGAFLRRFVMVAASALCVSIGSYLFQPNAFIFFGILHMIAAAWVMGILALRLPVFGIAALALIIAIVPYIWRSDVFLHPALIWLGLHVTPVVALDYVPVFPWLSPFLFGMACAKWASGRVWWHRFSMMAPDRRWARPLAWPGRYSLLIYLLHQPVLISAFMAWVFLSG